MDADAHTQWQGQRGAEFEIEALDALEHVPRRPDRAGRAVAGLARQPEDRNEAIRGEGVDTPAMRLGCLRHLLDEAVHQEDEVIGDLYARHRVEGADVDEKGGNLALRTPAIDIVTRPATHAAGHDRQED